MYPDFESEHTIREWQIGDIEGGVVNVGQSFQSGLDKGSKQGRTRQANDDNAKGGENMKHDWKQGESHSSAASPPQTPSPGPTSATPSSSHGPVSPHHSSSDPPPVYPLPTNLSELVAQVQWLQQRVLKLESQLTASPTEQKRSAPSRVEFKIDKLYVRELSGTLNMGVTSINDSNPEWVPTVPHIVDEDNNDWRRLEEEGDEDWFTDVSP